MAERYVQIGQAALRAPDGEPLPAVPLYVRVEGEETDAEAFGKLGAALLPYYKLFEKETREARV